MFLFRASKNYTNRLNKSEAFFSSFFRKPNMTTKIQLERSDRTSENYGQLKVLQLKSQSWHRKLLATKLSEVSEGFPEVCLFETKVKYLLFNDFSNGLIYFRYLHNNLFKTKVKNLLFNPFYNGLIYFRHVN